MAVVISSDTTERRARKTSTQPPICVDSLRRTPTYFFLESWPPFLDHANIQERAIDSVSHSLKNLFITKISALRQIERVFWRRAGGRIRVWTVIDTPDLEVENKIYDAQLELMDMLPDVHFDFSVIFRLGKPHAEISPEGATLVLSRT